MVLIDALIFDDNTVHERLGLHDSKTNFSVYGILSQEYWSRLPFPPSGDLSDPGIKPRSSALQADSLPSEPPGNPLGVKKRLIQTLQMFSFWVQICFLFLKVFKFIFL